MPSRLLAHARNRPRRAVAAVAAAAAVLVGTLLAAAPASADAPDPAQTLRSDPRGVLLGAHVTTGSQPDAESAITAFEGTLDRRLDVERWYSRWDDVQPVTPVAQAVARGRTPLLSIWPKKKDDTIVTWAAIARGDADAQIRAQAAGIASLGVPVYVAFHQEMDTSVSWGTPTEFRAAWRHYVEVARAAGATNALWTFVTTTGSYGLISTPGADAYYPGDDVVDRVGLNAYNWNACSVNKITDWRSLATITSAFRAWAQARGKTPLLAEFGTVEDAADPGRKAAWLTDAFALFRSWPELEAAVYYQGTGTCPWSVTTSAPATTAFAKSAADPTAHGRPSAWLIPSTKLGGAPLTVTFDLARSTGASSVNRSGIVRWELDPGDGSALVTGTGQPGKVAHTYAAGTFTPRLTVTDASGATAVDSRPVRAAGKPSVTAGERDITSTSATLQTWVGPQGLSATARIAWTPEGAAAPSGSVDLPVGAQTSTQKLTQAVSGLAPGTRYTWSVTATSAAGSTVVTRTFDTPGPPTVRAAPAIDLTRTAATVKLRVHPHLLATTSWVEWGPDLARRSADVPMAAASYERGSTVRLTGLTARTTYSYRVVARNALGTTYGPLQTLTTTS